MKKSLIFVFLLLVLNLVLGSSVATASEYDYFRVAILTVGSTDVITNEQADTIDVAPYVKSGRTLVPLRFMEKALGANIKWEDTTQTATLEFKGNKLQVTIGKRQAYVNSKPVILDVPAELNRGRTFVPLRFISENMGARVLYYPENQGIAITYTDKTGWKEFVDKQSGLVLKYPANFKVLKDDSELKLETSNESVFNLKSDTRPIDTVLEEIRDLYNKDGWIITSDHAIRSYSPIKGVTINAMNDSGATYDSYFFNVGNQTLSWEITAPDPSLSVLYDDYLAEEILLSAEVQK